MNEYRNLIGEVMEAGGAAPDVAEDSPAGLARSQNAAIIGIMKGLLPEAKGSQASVTVNTPEGLLMASNSASSTKEAAVVGGVMVVAVGASLAIPAMRMAQGRAQEARDENLRRFEEIEREIEEIEEAVEPAVPGPPRPVPAPRNP